MINIVKLDYIFFYRRKTKYYSVIIEWLEKNQNIPARI
jgi:hypothetical protein